jgi:hypothetical protein
MNANIGGLARPKVPRLAVRSSCAGWGIDAEKLNQVLFVRGSVGLLRILRVENDTKARSVGARLFFADATTYPVVQGDSGTAGEALVAALLADSRREVFASRDEKQYDFYDGTLHYKVGGPTAARKKADLLIRDDVDLPTQGTLPRVVELVSSDLGHLSCHGPGIGPGNRLEAPRAFPWQSSSIPPRR